MTSLCKGSVTGVVSVTNTIAPLGELWPLMALVVALFGLSSVCQTSVFDFDWTMLYIDWDQCVQEAALIETECIE